jgi:PAS domain S-box-containing protein
LLPCVACANDFNIQVTPARHGPGPTKRANADADAASARPRLQAWLSGGHALMDRPAIMPTGAECPFDENELIVTKTDLKGRITYANDVFIRLAKFSRDEVIGAPHSIVRHPDMPRSIFKLLWDTIQSKKEIFAYVVNMARNGDHYWVFAHVTPTLDAHRNVLGFHSNRRKPDRAQIARIEGLYRQLRDEENRHRNAKDGMMAGYAMLMNMLQTQGLAYDEFIFSV